MTRTNEPDRPSNQNRMSFRHVRVTIEFGTNPTVGWEQGPDGIRRFPRDAAGNVFFSCRFWRGMIASGLGILEPELDSQNRGVLRHVYVTDTADYIPGLTLCRDGGEELEQLPVGYRLSTRIRFPSKLFTVDAFRRFLNACGEEIGWAPTRSADGFGRFKVIELIEVSPMDIGISPSAVRDGDGPKT